MRRAPIDAPDWRLQQVDDHARAALPWHRSPLKPLFRNCSLPGRHYRPSMVAGSSALLPHALGQALTNAPPQCMTGLLHTFVVHNARTWCAKYSDVAGRGHHFHHGAPTPALRRQDQRILRRGRGDHQFQQPRKGAGGFPLAAGGRTAGVMQFGFAKPYEWLPREQELDRKSTRLNSSH